MTGIKFDANAEYICLAQDGLLAMKPDKVTDEEATEIPFGGMSALHFLRRGKIRLGQKVLMYRASGSVGTFAVQLAKYFGAHVTGVCSTANIGLEKSLGADHVIDHTRENLSKCHRHAYDIVFDTMCKSGFWRSMRSPKRGSFYVLARLRLSWMFGEMWASITSAGKVIAGIARTKPGDPNSLKGIIEVGKIRMVIDRRYQLEEIAEAHRYVKAGHKNGNVVIIIG